MSNLEFVKLNQVCTKITDGSHYSPKGISSGFPMLSVKDMLHNGFSYNDCKYVSEEDYNDLLKSDCVPLVDDVLIAKDGSYLKHVFVIKKQIKQGILSSIGILRPNLIKINPEYLKYYLHSDSVKETVAKKYVSGSALPRIILKNFGEIDIIYKPLIEQQKIAKVLSDLDAKIELNNKINTELEAMAKTLYDYWFVQFDFPDTNGKPYKTSGGKMAWNEELKREIPEGWKNGKLQDLSYKIGDGIHGTPKYVEYSEYSFINGNNLKNGFIQIEEDTKKVSFQEYEKYFIELNENTILLSINGTLGNLSVYTGEKVMLGKSAAYINCKEETRSYCYQFLNQDHMLNLFWNIATGSTIKNLSLDSIKKLQILIPCNDLIEQFCLSTKSIDDKKKNIFKENQKLASLRDWLLPMLMNGQVTVGDVQEELGRVAEPAQIYEKTEKKIIEKVKKAKPTAIKLNPVDVYKRTLIAAEIVFQLKDTYTLGHLKLQKMLYLCQELENMALPMNFLKQAMGPYDNQLARSLDKQFVEKKWFMYQKGELLKFKPLENCGKHTDDFNKYFEDQLEGINYIIKKFTIFTSTQIEAVATLYACWKEAIENNELINDKLIITKFYNWSKEKEKFKEENLVKALAWMRKNGIEPKTKLNE